MPSRLETAIDLIDRTNAGDPHRVTVDGQSVPKELAYSRHMTRWLNKIAPDAPEPLRLAARAQHIARWEIPRSTYPMDRIGYLKWRTTLYGHHATRAAELLRTVGYDDATIARVESLLRKQQLKTDPEMQTLEDVICLVFLETELSDFAARQPEDKVIAIIQKTWRKMSPAGHAAALRLAPTLTDPIPSLLTRALQAG
jgi:hypothetical protein